MGHLLLVCILSVEACNKMVVRVQTIVKELVLDKNGRRPLLQLLHPQCPRYLGPDNLACLHLSIPILVALLFDSLVALIAISPYILYLQLIRFSGFQEPPSLAVQDDLMLSMVESCRESQHMMQRIIEGIGDNEPLPSEALNPQVQGAVAGATPAPDGQVSGDAGINLYVSFLFFYSETCIVGLNFSF